MKQQGMLLQMEFTAWIQVDAFFPILRGVCTLDEAMDPETAKENMALAAEQAYRLFTLSK